MFPSCIMILKLLKKVHFSILCWPEQKIISMLKQFTYMHRIWKVSLRAFRKCYCLLCYDLMFWNRRTLLNFCWVGIIFDILIAYILWVVAHSPINIIFWKAVIRTFRSIYVNCFNRLPEVSTKFQKMHFFGQFKDQYSGRKNGNSTNDPIFSSTFSVLLFQNQSPIFCCPFFSENYLNPQVKINKMVNKYIVDYHPSPPQLISRIHTGIFLWTLKGFISSESFLNCFLNLYISPWLRKSFKFIVLRLLQIHLWVKKLKLFIFIHAPNQDFPLRFWSLSSRQTGIARSSQKVFFEEIFSWGERGREDYGVEKNTIINKGIGHKFW